MANFLALTKPKIVLLLTLTALVGMMLTIEFYTNILSSLASLLGFAFLAASSAALNQIFDRESEKIWKEQKNPLSAEIFLSQALNLQLFCYFLGSGLLLYFSNLLTFFYNNFWVFFYSLVYKSI
ncbi:MAG: hypothetical protein CM15mP31_2180 [Gammaproteobacteria bacterium]|nr:MAG: hypothetical protein CM15mP31_2180 [Gammaproteobacteria bacterium]